jgi:hypothetical protein
VDKATRLLNRQSMNWMADMYAAGGLVTLVACGIVPIRIAHMVASTDARKRKRALRIIRQHMRLTVGDVCKREAARG